MPACSFCGKDWVQGCWTAVEAASCGNFDGVSVRRAKEAAAAATQVEAIINARPKRRTRADIEATERRELARLKAKYETQ